MDPRSTVTYAGDGGIRRPPRIEPGTVLGHFEIIEEIGSGGMGVVYAARDLTLDRRVAVKVLRHDTFASEIRRARLLREARALAKVTHENVVAVFEAGEDRGLIYIVMELVEGKTLRDWLARPRRWQEAVDRLVRAGRGLAAAHHQGLVHRDFKPENVFLGKDGRVRVGDFGVVGVAGSAAGSEPSSGSATIITETGEVLGTPRFMSPEQHQARPVDARTDQFAFAASLYEALYRRPAFAGNTLREVRENALDGNVTAIPRRSGVPRRIEEIVRRGLATDPGARFPTMDAMLSALAWRPAVTPLRALAVLGALAIGVGAWGLLRRQADPCAGAAARLGGVWDPAVKSAVERTFTGSGRPYAADSYRRVAAALDAYSASWAETHTQVCRATAVERTQPAQILDARMACLDRRLGAMGALTRLFAAAPDGEVVDRAVSAATGLDPASGCTAATRPAEAQSPEARALQLRLLDAAALVRAGKVLAAQEQMPSTLDSARRLGDKRLLAEALVLQGKVTEEKDPAAAVTALEQAVSLGAASDDDDVQTRALLELLQVVGFVQGRRTEAEALRPGVEAAVRRSKNPRHLVDMMQMVANLLYEEGRYPEALAAIQEVVLGFDQAYGAETIEKALAMRDLGIILDAMGRREESLAAAEGARAIAEKAVGPDHVDYAQLLNSLGVQQWRRGRLDEAQELFSRVLAIREASYGADSVKAASALGNLGLVAFERQDWDKALAYFQRELAIKEKVLGPDSLDTAVVTNTIANAYAVQKKVDDAMVWHRRTLAIRERALPPSHPDIACSAMNIGYALREGGRPDEAIPWLLRALAIFETAYPPTHPATGETLVSLAKAYLDTHRAAEALPLLERARTALGEKPEAGSLADWELTKARALRSLHRRVR